MCLRCSANKVKTEKYGMLCISFINMHRKRKFSGIVLESTAQRILFWDVPQITAYHKKFLLLERVNYNT